MSTKPLAAKRVAVANIFGTLGYLSIIFQWGWSLLLLCYPLISAHPELLLPSAPAPSSPQAAEIAPAFTPVMTIVAAAVTLLMLIATVIVLARLPKAIGKKAATLTKTAARAVIPVVTHHKKISKQQRKKLSYKLSLSIKAIVLILPLVMLLFVDTSGTIPSLAAWSVGLFCALCSFVYFAIQQMIALIGGISRDQLW